MHWFHHGSSHDELPDTLQETPIGRYLSGNKSFEEALEAFCRPVEDKFMNTSKSESVEPLLRDACDTIISIASATTHTSENRKKLADIVIALQYRPTLMKGDHICRLNNAKVWKELPIFGMQMREAWNMAPSVNSDQKHQDAWINLNAFAATLTAASQARQLQPTDFSLFGIWTIREALEQQEEVLEIALQSAAVWFIYTAQVLWGLCQQQKTFDGKLAKPGPEFATREWRGYEKDRWTSWEVAFKHVIGNRELNDKTKKLVNDALAAMKTVG